jgi:hypothetical protein
MTNDNDKSGKKDAAPRYSDPLDSLFDSFIGGLPAFTGMFGTSFPLAA